MSIAKLAVRQPVLANLIAVFAIVVGIGSYLAMPKRDFPKASLNIAIIQTFYPGASPEDVERLITRKIEEEVADVKDLKSLTSISREGLSVVVLEYEQEVSDFSKALLNLNNEVKKVKNLPANLDPPEVVEAVVEHIGIYLSVGGEADEMVLREIALDLKDEISNIPGVARIEFMAWREREIWVELDREKLEGHGLTPGDVADAIAAENRNIPGGSLRTGRIELLVRTMGEFEEASQIRQVVVHRDDRGGIVTVGDLGTIRDTLEEASISTHVNGRPGIVLEIYNSDEGNAMVTVAQIKKVIADFREILPARVYLTTFMDTSKWLRQSLSDLSSNALFGLVFVTIILWFFMGTRTSILAVIGLPVAILGGVIILHVMGVSVNRLTLFGMILILGILVDDSIVVIENIARHLAMGKTRAQAAVDGTNEVIWPVIAATATTIAAFSALFMMTGVMGTFLSNIPKVVIAALAGSLIEALFILPSHMAEHGKIPDEKGWRERMWIPVRVTYLRLLERTLAHRYLALLVAMGVALSFTLLGALVLDVKLLEQEDPEFFEVRIEMPSGTRLEATEEVLDEVEKRLRGLPPGTVQDILTIAGFALTGGTSTNRGTNYGETFVFFTPAEGRRWTGFQLLEKARGLLDGLSGPVQMEVAEMRRGPPTGAPVAVEIRGRRQEVLMDIAAQVQAELARQEGVKDIRTDFLPGKKELRVRVDRPRAAMVGLGTAQVAQYVRAAYHGILATIFKAEREEVDVLVKFRDSERNEVAGLSSLMIRTVDGRQVPLRELAQISEELGSAGIRRIDRKRAITVLANVDEEKTTGMAVNKALQDFLKEMESKHPGYTLKAGGEFEMTRDSIISLFKALVLSFIVIFAILGAQFKSYVQPFIVMSAVPFSFIGVVFGLIVSGKDLSMFSLMGIIALGGIVVNDSLVMVDFINRIRRTGLGRRESILQAAEKRLRPIMLTTVTTMGGLIPVAYAFIGKENLMLTPMALAIVWGLLASTILTLFLVPSLYAIFDDIHIRVTGKEDIRGMLNDAA